MTREIFDELAEIKKVQALILAEQKSGQAVSQKHVDLLEKHNETLLRLTITVERHEERSTKLEFRQDGLSEAVQIIKNHVVRLQGAGHLIKIILTILTATSVFSGLLYGAFQLAQKIGL